MGSPGAGREFRHLDPLLGIAHDPREIEALGYRFRHGFAVLGDRRDARAIRIVALGGSTTEVSAGNWPKTLFEECRKRGIAVVIFNGGVASYSSGQELLKLIRDGLRLRPDVVVSYGGVNDRGCGTCGGSPLHHPMHGRVFNSLLHGKASVLLPNLISVLRQAVGTASIDGIEWGLPQDTTCAQQWLRNVRMMKAVSREFGARYVAFLQPVFGVGTYRPSENEKRNVVPTEKIRDDVECFFDETRRSAVGSDSIVDLADVFAGRNGLYRDFCHVNEEGNRLVGRAVFRELESRGLLRGRRR